MIMTAITIPNLEKHVIVRLQLKKKRGGIRGTNSIDDGLDLMEAGNRYRISQRARAGLGHRKRGRIPNRELEQPEMHYD
jgi:hypothetical protein